MKWNFDEYIPREGTDCIKYDLRLETFGRQDVIPMWVADMDFKTPDFIIAKLRKRLEHEIMGYSLRSDIYFSSIAGWILKRHSWKIMKEWICFCPGIVPALNLSTLAFTRPGDSVIVQPPVYTPFFSAVEAHGRNLIYNPLIKDGERWRMDIASLESVINESVKMIIISNPHNPVGRAWSAEELEALASVCVKNNILILSDEIHCDLVLPGYKHVPIASLSEDVADITVTCVAPSKTFNLAGLSTSSLIIQNPVLRKYFKKKIESIHVENGNIFGNVASVAAYSEGGEWLDELLKYLQGNIEYVTEYLKARIPRIVPSVTEATYLMWLDCRNLGMNSKELQDFFITKALVGLNEGSQFGPGGEGYMRMNIGTTREVITKALYQIEKAVNELK